MSKYGAEVQEKAYELLMIQQLPFQKAMRRMRDEYPTFSGGTLSRWKNDPVLNWEGRYRNYCDKLAERNDLERLRRIKPIVHAVQEIRDDVYNQLVRYMKILVTKKENSINEKNLAQVLTAFSRLVEIEYQMTGGDKSPNQIKNVINIIFIALEKNPTVGPVIRAHKTEIEEAIFEMIAREK